MGNYNVNPMQLIQMIRQGQNPQQLLLNVLEQNISPNNMVASNIISLAKQNKTKEIEQIARNICKERGLDFDKEFSNFKKSLLK